MADVKPSLPLLPSMRTAPSFLSSNAQSHLHPLSAWADILDNCREGEATRVDINVRSVSQQIVVEIIDNGCGMDEKQLRDGILSIGYTDKGLETGKHYGMGSTTSIPRLATDGLILSLTRGGLPTVGYLSTRLSDQRTENQTVVPQCTLARTGSVLQTNAGTDVTFEQRAESLKVILAHSPFSSEGALRREFDALGQAGTKIVLWNLGAEHQLEQHSQDVCFSAAEDAWAHETSLRGLLEVLYYHDNQTPHKTKVYIKGGLVVPRNWPQFLRATQHEYSYRPHAASTAHDSERPCARTLFGYAQPLAAVVGEMRGAKSGKRKQGSPGRLAEYCGVFYYRKGRLTIPLLKTALQTAKGNQMPTAEVRLLKRGEGLIGVCRENFLTQAHNKRQYIAASGSGLHFEMLAQQVSRLMSEHLRNQVMADSSLPVLLGKVPPKAPEQVGKRKAGGAGADGSAGHALGAGRSKKAARAVQPEPGGRRGAAARGERSTSVVETSRADGSLPAGELPPVPPVRAVDVAGRRMRAPDGAVGRVVAAFGRCRLLQQGHRLTSKSYLPVDLVPTAFDPGTALLRAVPAQMCGSGVRIWWDNEEDAGSWYSGVLQPPAARHRGVCGWFEVEYGTDGDQEEVFFGVRPDGSTLICREDGEVLELGTDIQLPDGFARDALRALAETQRPETAAEGMGASEGVGRGEPTARGGVVGGLSASCGAFEAPAAAPGSDGAAAQPRTSDGATDSLGKAQLEAAALLSALQAMRSSSAAGAASEIAALRRRLELARAHLEVAEVEAQQAEARSTATSAVHPATPAPLMADSAHLSVVTCKRARPSPATQPAQMATMAPSPPPCSALPTPRRPAAVDAASAGAPPVQGPGAGAAGVGDSASEVIDLTTDWSDAEMVEVECHQDSDDSEGI